MQRKHVLKKLSGLLVAIFTIIVVWAPAAEAYTLEEGALFNDPTGEFAAKFELMSHVQDTIDNTPKGEAILISTYLLDRRVVVDKLVKASNRGVSVQVVLDRAIDSEESQRLEAALNADNDEPTVDPTPEDQTDPLPTGLIRGGPDRSFTKKCTKSCRGDGGNMHAKFYAFSRSGTSSNIVMISSANLNAGGALAGYNDLYTMVERPTTYQKFAAIHNEMVDDTPRDDAYQTHTEGAFESRFFPMRDATRDTDPVMRDLSRVHCRGTTGGTGRDGRTTINVSMFYWAGERGMWITNRLLKLQSEGCIVRVIYGAPSNEVAAVLRHAAHQGRIDLYDSRVHTDGDGIVDIRVHAKYMIISGWFGKDTSARHVFTGSQNWVGGSLTRGDEVMLAIENGAAYGAYLKNWSNVARTGARKIGG